MRTPLRLTRGSAVLLAVLLATQPSHSAPVPKKNATLARRLYDSFRTIRTISCEIRKTVVTAGRTDRWLSRIHYKSPNRIHVENVAPFKRRIVADGTNLYYHVADHAKGFSAPLAALREPMLSAARNIPATPTEHLIKLLEYPETALPGNEEFPVRRSYRTGAFLVILSCDDLGRLVQVDFFKTEKAETLVARYTYSSFTGTPGGAWVPKKHKATLFLPDDETVTETRRIDNLVVDKPVAASLFDASLFFRNVKFVDDLRKTTK